MGARYEVSIDCPYCLRPQRLQVASGATAIVRRGLACPSCGQWLELTATFAGERLSSVVLSRAPAPGQTQH